MLNVFFTMSLEIFLVFFGVVIGFYGTLAGIGGGFLIVPVLMNYFGFSHSAAVGTSLSVIFANSFSGSLSYLYQKRVDTLSAIKFALATIPGAYIGFILNHLVTNTGFRAGFGVLLLCLAAIMLFRKTPENRRSAEAGVPVRIITKWPVVHRNFTDRYGTDFAYGFNELHGIIISFFVGIIASLFGIGGGIIHVPAMTFLFGFPVHIATATSHFILCITALSSAVMYGAGNDIVWNNALWMAGGAIIGAQLGGAVSRFFRSVFILRLISLLLVFLALQMAFRIF